MKRRIFAIVEVDDERAFAEIDDGPVAYLEKEFGWLEQSGISLKECFVVDEDAEDPWERYIGYLAQFAFDHSGDECTNGISEPMSYAVCFENQKSEEK